MSQNKDKHNRYETKFNLSELYSLDDLKKLFKIFPELSNLCIFTHNSNISPIAKVKTFKSDNSESIKLSNSITKINKFKFFKIIFLKLKSYFEVNESFIFMKTLSIFLNEFENMEKFLISNAHTSKNKSKNGQKNESKHENDNKFCIKFEKLKKQNFKNNINKKAVYTKNNGSSNINPNASYNNSNIFNPYETFSSKKNRVYFKVFDNLSKKDNKNEIQSFMAKNGKYDLKYNDLNKTERKISNINLSLSNSKKYEIKKKIVKTKTSAELGLKIYIDSNNNASAHSHNFSTNFETINFNNNLKEFNTINSINNITKKKIISFSKNVKNDVKNKSDLFNNNNNLYINIYEQKKNNSHVSTDTKTNEENNKPIIIEKESVNNDLNMSLLYNIETEDFDIFDLDKKSNKKSLILIGNYVFNRFGFNNIIKYSMFENWCKKISNGYNRKNPYHTDLHAGDITQSCLVYFKCGKINEICKLSQLSKCALFLSCICHDYKHPGVNNNFLKDTKNALAIQYNDISILENMHISESFKLTIQYPNCDIFAGMNPENYKQLRKEMISCVLFTDMTKHNMTIDFMKEVSSDSKNKEKDYHQDYMDLLIHSADISNPTKKFDLYYKWAELVVEEFFQQGDKEKELGLKCTFDRETTTIYKNQLGFINYIEIPFFSCFTQIFPKLKFLMDNLNNNKNEILRLQEKDNKEKENKDKKKENDKKGKN